MPKPKGGKPLRVVLGGSLSPTSSGLRSPSATFHETKFGATARETRSVAARRMTVSPSSSSDGVEIIK